MDTRRLLLAALLSMVVLFGWQLLFPPPEAPIGPVDPVTQAPTAGGVAVEPEPPPSRTSEAPDPAESGVSAPTWEPAEAASEERVVLETAEARLQISNRGAQLLAYEVKGHRGAAGGVVDLVQQRAEGAYPFALTDRRGGPSALSEVLFEVERSPGGGGEEAVTLTYSGAAGAARKRFALGEGGLLETRIEVPGRSDWGVLLGPGIRNPSQRERENRFARRAAVYLLGDSVERVDPSRTEEASAVPATGLRWIGLEDTYFLTAIVPREGLEQVLVQPVLGFPGTEGRSFTPYAEEDEVEGTSRELRLILRPESDSLDLTAYFGPKELERLTALPHGLDRTVDLGMFAFLGRPLLAMMRWIHDNLVSNYGWAIVLLTILIRLLLFPLNHKSIVSMRKMQALNPKIQAIREKYRPKLRDKQGRPNRKAQADMNQQIMGLYKSEGVNPAGGCFPMLLQFPVLLAFYSLLSAAIEIRQAPWILWIKDLSAPDPYYALPLVMGATMFLQQKMSPATGDPMQRRIFMFMPIIFTVMFLGFPSGLVLYWLTNNVLAIAQQAAYGRFSDRAAEGKAASAPARKTSAKKTPATSRKGRKSK